VIGLFLVGTLLDDELRNVFAKPSSGRPARLSNHVTEKTADGAVSLCLHRANGLAEGLLFDGFYADELERLDYYEGIFGSYRRPVVVECDGNPVDAEAYVTEKRHASSGDLWDLEDWRRQWAPFVRRQAAQVMDEYRICTPPEEVAGKLHVISARAQAERAASERPGPQRRDALIASQVENIATRTVYSKFFRLDECDVRVPRFDGLAPSDLERTVFISADAVTVLPYDPIRDRVLLIEQFRIGPHARGDSEPWLFEAIAGRVDGGESWETAAHREAQEEAALQLTALEKVAEFYPSPGAVSEFLVSYLGLAELPDGLGGVHGVASEQEDIRSRVVGFAEFEKLMKAGHFRNAPLLISAQWLVAYRGRLRNAANGA